MTSLYSGDNFWKTVSENIASQRPETPHLLNLTRPSDILLQQGDAPELCSRPTTALASKPVKLKPLSNAPKLPSLDETQQRLRQTKERRRYAKTKKSQVTTSQSPRKTYGIRRVKKSPETTDVSQTLQSLYVGQEAPKTPPKEKVKRSKTKITPKAKESIDKTLSQSLEIIKNENNNYTEHERVRACQMAMKLNLGSQNSHAVSSILFGMAQKSLHLVASQSMIKDLLAFLAI